MAHHDEEKCTDTANRGMAPMREMTVGEMIDRRIDKAERQARDLRCLKGAMSSDFLQSGCTRFASLLEG